MNEALTTVILLVLCFGWRWFTSWQLVQRCLHICGPLAGLFQWYTILFIGLGSLLIRTFYDIVVFEYLKYDFLNAGEFIDEPDFIPGLSTEEHAALHISPWLRIFALGAPVAGVLAGVVITQHVSALVMAGVRRKKMAGDRLPWKASDQENIVLLVIAMPLVFILMAVRAEIRSLAVMTGSAWLPYHGQDPPAKSWEEVKSLELATYTTDLEVANFFQYVTIFAFGRLCVYYLQDAPTEYRKALKLAGLQGVYLYVFFGAFRAIGNLAIALLGENEKESRKAAAAAVLRDKVMTQVGPVFTVATLLCVYNMLILGSMSDIKKHLGSANLKFQGVRALVLISQIQIQVLMGLCAGSPLYQAAEKLPAKYQDEIHSWHFSPYRAQLMHASLLCYECLLVVLFNRCVWSSKTDYMKVAQARELSEDGSDVDVDQKLPALQQRLLVEKV